MARSWTRSQQRRYKEERMKQAALVADRLLGKNKPIFWADHDDYSLNMNMYTPSPRSSSIITGIVGV